MEWRSGWQWMHHIGWSLPLAFFRPISALLPSEGRPEGSLHPRAAPAGTVPAPVAAGARFAFVSGALD
jgi:hypothetical protein